jgi:WD40 repeat protein
VSPSGKFIAGSAGLIYAGGHKSFPMVWVWDAESGRLISTASPSGKVLALSPDGRFLVIASLDDQFDWALALYRTADMSLVYRWDDIDGQTSSAAFSPDGKYLALAQKHAVLVFSFREL